MCRLPWIIIFIFCVINSFAQSPHGELLLEDCKVCHNSDSWKIDIDTFHYNHSNYDFELYGVHLLIDCKDCHISLKFEKVKNECNSCHNDIHSQSLGNDCARCHTPQNWLVDNIPAIHEENGFPLEGSHLQLNCIDCHQSENSLIFNRIGNDCYNCHLDIYNETTQPNHLDVGFSTDCILCHDPILSGDWNEVSHYFFPLTLGHDIEDCTLCHTTNNYRDISPDCYSCHEEDFIQTTNPNHNISEFSIDCTQCHTTEQNWKPVKYEGHDDKFFPIYSGNHSGEWSECIECHTNENDFSIFTCLECHEHNDPNDLANEHEDVNNYSYDSKACLECHPKGN